MTTVVQGVLWCHGPPCDKGKRENRLKSTFMGLIHKNESFQGLENLYGAPRDFEF